MAELFASARTSDRKAGMSEAICVATEQEASRKQWLNVVPDNPNNGLVTKTRKSFGERTSRSGASVVLVSVDTAASLASARLLETVI